MATALREKHHGEHPLGFYMNGRRIAADIARGLCALHERRVCTISHVPYPSGEHEHAQDLFLPEDCWVR